MTLSLPKIRVGTPLRFRSLSVFPLFSEGASGVDYLLSDEALPTNLVTVEEVSERGSVPELLVRNESDSKVLFLEGEELVGAKQNRILNTSVLVAAKSSVRIPVSCVEQGRWRFSSRTFTSSGRHSPAKLRHALKASVSKSLKEKAGYHSNQIEVWSQVRQYEEAHHVATPTGAMSDTFEALKEKIAEGQALLKYVDGATGIAVALGPNVVCIELFDKPQTCEKVWERAISGFLIDTLGVDGEGSVASQASVESTINATQTASWSQVNAVGDGEEFRAEFGTDHASALCFDNQLVHGSVVGA